MSALYKQVSGRILDQIARGSRKVGDRLPPEAEFADELGVSRSTIRLAFNELESSGVLRRRKRAGTEIIAAEPQPRFSMATSGMHELLSLGRNTAFIIENTTLVQTDDVGILSDYVGEADSWLEVYGSRTMSGETIPFSTNKVYVPERYVKIDSLLKGTGGSVFQAIEKTFNVSVGRVTQRTLAIKCPKQDAVSMGLKAGEPVLQISAALYVKGGELMELSIATFDPSRFQIFSDVSID